VVKVHNVAAENVSFDSAITRLTFPNSLCRQRRINFRDVLGGEELGMFESVCKKNAVKLVSTAGDYCRNNEGPIEP
jgi:hypothetical protein